MKKILKFLLIIVFIFPIIVKANMFKVPDTDIVINIDEDIWTVLTRYDINDKSLLDEYGISYDEIRRTFFDNDIYLYAYAFWDEEMNYPIDIYISKSTNQNMINDLRNLTEEELTSIANNYLTGKNNSYYDFYRNEYENIYYDYIFYTYEENGYYLGDYYTIINGNDYHYVFQSTIPFDEERIKSIDEMVDNIHFEFGEEIENKEEKNESILLNIVMLGLIGMILFLIIKSLKNKEVN